MKVGACAISLSLLLSVASAECIADVDLSGDPAAVSLLTPHLEGLGVCAADAGLRVHATLHADSMQVSYVDETGAQTRRAVDAPRTAAMLIESWTRSTLGAPLPNLPRLAPIATTKHAPAPDPPANLGLRLAAGLDLIYTDDQSLWYGLTLGACQDLGPVCLGGWARLALDSDEVGGSETYDSSRSAIDAMASLDLPIDLGGSSLVPGVGLGLSWLRTARDPLTDGMVGAPLVANTRQFKLDGHLRWVMPIDGRLAFQVGLHAEAAPFARTAPFFDPPREAAPEPTFYLRSAIGFGYQL